jgi:hypothetical protein
MIESKGGYTSVSALPKKTTDETPVKKVLKKKKKVDKYTSSNLTDLSSYKSDRKKDTKKKKVIKRIGKKNKKVVKKETIHQTPEQKLSSQHKTQTSVLVDKILKFCMVLTGKQLFPYQIAFAKRIIKAVITNDSQEVTALFARQSGKSETVSIVVSGLMVILPTLANTPAFANDPRFEKFKTGFWVGIFAPSQRQTKFVFGRIRTYLSGTSKDKNAKGTDILEELQIDFASNNGETVVITNALWDSKVTCVTASDNANIEGESLHFILCDETQDISDFVLEKSIFPMGSFYNASTVMIGTPNTRKGYFYGAIERNNKTYKRTKGKVKNHFEYDWRTIVKYNPNYRKFVDKERAKGENRDEFRMSYNLEWILSREMFLTEALLRDKVWNDDLSFVPTDLENQHVVGIDLGKAQDSTVIHVVEPDWINPVIQETAQQTKDGGFNEQYTVYKFKVKDVLELEGDNWEEQYETIMSYLRNFRIVRIVMDSTGVGSPIYDRLRIALPNIEVLPFSFQTASKSDLYKHFITELGAGRIQYPHHESIVEDNRIQSFHKQAVDMEKFYRGSYLVCQHPDRRGARDDYVDSLALACWAVKSANKVVQLDTVRKNHVIKPTLRQQTRRRRTSRRRDVMPTASGLGRNPLQNLHRNAIPVNKYVHAYGLAGQR